MSDSYEHKQYGFLYYLIGAIGGAFILVAVLLGENSEPFIIFIISAVVMFLLAGCFGHLATTDAGDHLSVRFGPIRIFGTRIRYDLIARAEVSRTRFWHGWGVHCIPFYWVTYNISGYDCVRVMFKRPKGLFRYRYACIGTDDADGLAAFLRSKMSAPAAP